MREVYGSELAATRATLVGQLKGAEADVDWILLLIRLCWLTEIHQQGMAGAWRHDWVRCAYRACDEWRLNGRADDGGIQTVMEAIEAWDGQTGETATIVWDFFMHMWIQVLVGMPRTSRTFAERLKSLWALDRAEIAVWVARPGEETRERFRIDNPCATALFGVPQG